MSAVPARSSSSGRQSSPRLVLTVLALLLFAVSTAASSSSSSLPVRVPAGVATAAQGGLRRSAEAEPVAKYIGPAVNGRFSSAASWDTGAVPSAAHRVIFPEGVVSVVVEGNIAIGTLVAPTRSFLRRAAFNATATLTSALTLLAARPTQLSVRSLEGDIALSSVPTPTANLTSQLIIHDRNPAGQDVSELTGSVQFLAVAPATESVWSLLKRGNQAAVVTDTLVLTGPADVILHGEVSGFGSLLFGPDTRVWLENTFRFSGDLDVYPPPPAGTAAPALAQITIAQGEATLKTVRNAMVTLDPTSSNSVISVVERCRLRGSETSYATLLLRHSLVDSELVEPGLTLQVAEADSLTISGSFACNLESRIWVTEGETVRLDLPAKSTIGPCALEVQGALLLGPVGVDTAATDLEFRVTGSLYLAADSHLAAPGQTLTFASRKGADPVPQAISLYGALDPTIRAWRLDNAGAVLHLDGAVVLTRLEIQGAARLNVPTTATVNELVLSAGAKVTVNLPYSQSDLTLVDVSGPAPTTAAPALAQLALSGSSSQATLQMMGTVQFVSITTAGTGAIEVAPGAHAALLSSTATLVAGWYFHVLTSGYLELRTATTPSVATAADPIAPAIAGDGRVLISGDVVVAASTVATVTGVAVAVAPAAYVRVPAGSTLNIVLDVKSRCTWTGGWNVEGVVAFPDQACYLFADGATFRGEAGKVACRFQTGQATVTLPMADVIQNFMPKCFVEDA